jgi:hypothetical protein
MPIIRDRIGDKKIAAMEYNEQSWMDLFEASSWEFPAAVQKWMIGEKQGNQEVEDVALKAYHAWASLANESVDRFYQTKGFCELITGSLNWLLQWQRLGRSITDTMIPGAMAESRSKTQGEDRVLDEIVQRLGREVRQLTARLNMLEGRNGFRTGSKIEADTDSASRQ